MATSIGAKGIENRDVIESILNVQKSGTRVDQVKPSSARLTVPGCSPPEKRYPDSTRTSQRHLFVVRVYIWKTYFCVFCVECLLICNTFPVRCQIDV